MFWQFTLNCHRRHSDERERARDCQIVHAMYSICSRRKKTHVPNIENIARNSDTKYWHTHCLVSIATQRIQIWPIPIEFCELYRSVQIEKATSYEANLNKKWVELCIQHFDYWNFVNFRVIFCNHIIPSLATHIISICYGRIFVICYVFIDLNQLPWFI